MSSKTKEKPTATDIVKETTETKKQSKTETKEAEPLFYIGPDITHVVRHATVFTGGTLPEAVEDKITEFPALRTLFIPLDEVSAKIVELRKESALTTIYSQVADKFK